MAEELFEKIPVEKRWEITTKALTNIIVLRGDKMMPPLLGIGEGIIAPVQGLEKYLEINTKIWGEGGKLIFPMFKEMFNIPVEDAVEAAKLYLVVVRLAMGPEGTGEIVVATPERAVVRWTKCPWWERYKENKVEPEFIPCVAAHLAWVDEGLTAINPMLTSKLTKAMPSGDPYCELIFEFKKE